MVSEQFLHGALVCFKGAGGPRSIFTFLLFLIEGNASYQEFFYRTKNIVFKVITFLNLENTDNYRMCVNFARNSPKINFKIYPLLRNLRKTLETL